MNSNLTVSPRLRLILALEMTLGLAPLTITYLYHVPIGIFWVGRVFELANEGIGNAYTAGVAIAFVAGGIGLLGVWVALTGRLIGRPTFNRMIRSAIWIGILVGVILIAFLPILGTFWSDYYLVGAPVLISVHQLRALLRSNPQRLEDAPA